MMDIREREHYREILARQHSPRHKQPLRWRLREAWLILLGRNSLHLAWQVGLDHGTRMEYERTVVNGGR
jgi:hypothetical protein